MADKRALYTEEAVGANHPTKTDVINRLSLVEHNNDGTHKMTSGVGGDMFYHNGTSLVRLAKGSSGQVLRQNAGLTAPEWGDYLPVGGTTKVWFYQNVAPAGWTIDAVPADAVLAVKGGAQAYNVNGGNQAGTWTQPNHTHTGPSHQHTGPSHQHTGPSHTHGVGTFAGPSHQHTGPSHAHTTPAHTLIISEMPAHDHTVAGQPTYQQGGSQRLLGSTGGETQHPTGPAGGGGSHAHGNTGAEGTGLTGAQGTGAITGTSAADGTGLTGAQGTGLTGAQGTGLTGVQGTGATGNGATAATYRPLAQVGIICSKD